MSFAAIRAIEYHFPSQVVDNASLEQQFPDFPAAKIFAKTGIASRHIAAENECSSDLAFAAAEKLFACGKYDRSTVDALLFCTQSPDYLLPTTACLLQDRLGLPTTIAALDFNLGCSGFVYGLGLAKGMIETGQASRVLLLTGETYSKFIHPQDRSVRTLFGDAAAATLIESVDAAQPQIGPFVYGTDGRGGAHLTVRAGGLRHPDAAPAEDGKPGDANLFMNGPEIFSFTLGAVPDAVAALLAKAELHQEDVDLYVFHQANAYMLEHLRTKIGLPKEKFFVFVESCGNTVSSTIPIALKEAEAAGKLHSGMKVMLVGFGVGLSWAATMIRWQA